MKNKKTIIIVLTILFLFFILSVIFSIFTMLHSNIISGITINNIDVSKMSKEKTTSMINNLIKHKNKTELKLEYTKEQDKYEKNLDLSILNIDYHLSNSINEAFNIGREKNIFINNFDIIKTFIKKKNLNLNISLDEKMLDNIISDISTNLPGKMVQSSYYIEDKNLIITKGTAGFTVDKETFKKDFNNLLANLTSSDKSMQIPVKYTEPNSIDIDKIHSEIYKKPKNAYFKKSPFKVYSGANGVDFDVKKAKEQIQSSPDKKDYTISLQYTEPEVKLKDLDIDIFPDRLATFSTRYDVKNTDRSTNLNIAASKIDGTILSPGEEFSYNKIVGERSISAGYKEAKIYQNGEIVDGLGGGICQISSTLYNAVIFANLKITERYNHQFVTSYVSAGRDATVAYGLKDLKFINNRAYPIKINMSVNSGVAKVDIFGLKEKDEYEIDFDVETVSNIPYKTKYKTDDSLPSGTEKVKQRGTNGIIVNAYKIIKQNGVTVSKELVSKDTYNALERVILKSSK